MNPLMIFAAGFGTRMGALTADKPKPLIEVAGKPLIDHALDLAKSAGATPIVVNTHYRHDRMAAHLQGRAVTLSHETPEILDTGGGLRHALPHLGHGPCLTLNSDAIWTGRNPLDTLLDAWSPEMGALLLVIEAGRATGRTGGGDFRMSTDGRLGRNGDLVFTGAQMIDPNALNGVDERVFSLNAVWDRLESQGQLYGVCHDGGWCDVGHPAGITAAETLLSPHHG